MVTTASLNRIFSKSNQLSLSDIALIQNAYILKDYKTIKRILNIKSRVKTNILQQGSLVIQYVRALSNPNTAITNYVQTKYNVLVYSTGNPSVDFQRNWHDIHNPPPPPDPFSLLFPYRNFVKIFKALYINLEGTAQLPNFWSDILNFAQILPTNLRKFYRLSAYRFKFVRINIKYITQSGQIAWYSTIKSTFKSLASKISQMINDLLYSDSQHWKSISPKNEDLIDDITTNIDPIASIQQLVINYYK